MEFAPDYSSQRLADRAQIQDAIYRFCRAMDRLDFDTLRGVFHPDAIDCHSIYNGNIDGLIEWVRQRHRGITFSMHTISNILIEFAGPDTAIVESYCVSLQRYAAAAQVGLEQFGSAATANAEVDKDMTACVRYVDRFERREGAWRIQQRTAIYDSTRLHEVPESAPKLGADWTVGRRSKEDPLYAARAAAGLPG